jgi:hypothetical protein
MFHATHGTFEATNGIFSCIDSVAPDELRVVVALALSPTLAVHVRVLTNSVPNNVHDYHNHDLLASHVAVTVTDAQGVVASTAVAVQTVTVNGGTYAAYAVTLARSVVPSEIIAVSVLSPYVAGTMASTAPLPLTQPMPIVEVAADGTIEVVPWKPTAAAGSSAPSMPAPHKLVVGKPVDVHFTFVAPSAFDAGAAGSFSATQNGVAMSLASATVSGTSLVVAVTAGSVAQQRFVFVAFGRLFVFVVEAADVYAYPTMLATTRSVAVVTLGQPLGVTSTFDATLPAATAASVVVTPTGSAAVTHVATVASASVSITHTVAHDVAHSGVVTLTYGPTSASYAWGAGALTAAHIYTFPSSFTYDGTGNAYAGGAHLKSETAGTLVLTFAGGDMLHSSVTAAQIDYVKFVQAGTETTILPASLACSDPLETVTATLLPAGAQDLTLKVRLKAPDGVLGTELTTTVPASDFEQIPNAVVTTPGLQLWLDGADPLGTSSAPSNDALITTWADKSGLMRHAAVQTANKAKFVANAKGGRGAVLFYESTFSTGEPTQRYLSSFAFPSSAYTIVMVINGHGGIAVSGPTHLAMAAGVFSGGGLITYAKSANGAAWTPNTPDWTVNRKFNIQSVWTTVSMVVDGATCSPYVNGIAQNATQGPTAAFTGFVVGGHSVQSNYQSEYFVGRIGEVAVYSGALSSTSRWAVERALGTKWRTWPYNVSPLWDVAAYSNNQAFGAEYDAFTGSYLGGWGSEVYWEWVRATYDMTLLMDITQYPTKHGVHINMPSWNLPYTLNNPSTIDYGDFRPIADAPWAIRWGYQQAQRPTHVGVRCDDADVDAAAQFTLTGFSSSSFTSGTVLVTLNGTQYGRAAPVWTALTAVGSYTHFEFRQTAGPFLVGKLQKVMIGRSSASDTSGLGSVARANLVCWLDGSDPSVTGEPLVDGATIVRVVDKSGNARHATPYNTQYSSANSMIFSDSVATAIAKGVVSVPKQWSVAWSAPTVKVAFPHTAFPETAYTVCMLLKGLNRSGALATADVRFATCGSDLGYQMGMYQGTFQVTSSIYKYPLWVQKTKKLDGSYVQMNGDWAFMAMVYTGGTVVPYFNGTRLQTITGSVYSIDTSKQFLYLMSNYSGDYVSYGDIGEFGLYNRALTDAEIGSLRSNLATKFGIPLTPV